MADDKSKKTLPEQINIMQASSAGAPIAVKAYDARRWASVENPAFNWGTSDYKVELDYTELFNSVVSSVNYAELHDTIYYLERGKKLGNTVDYSVDVLQDSKTKIADNVKLKFNDEYQAIREDITPTTIQNTGVYSVVYNSLREKYYRVAEADVAADQSILTTYGSLNAYVDAKYKASIDKEMSDLVGELNLTIKKLTNDSAIQALVNISDDTIDDIILSQKAVDESTLYDNNADDIPTLKQRMSTVMNDAVGKYNATIDDTYAVAYDDDIRVTIKKQLEEPEPAISINYSLFNYSLNGEANPQMDWGYNDEGKVVTVTGITSEEAQAMVDNSYNNFLNELKKEEAARKQGDLDYINFVNKSIAKLSRDHDQFLLDTDTRLSAMAASLSSTIADFKKNGIFTNLSVTNPIQGSLIGNNVTTNTLTVKSTSNFTGKLTVNSTSEFKDKITAKDISAADTTVNTLTVNSTSEFKNTMTTKDIAATDIKADTYFKSFSIPAHGESTSFVLLLNKILPVGDTSVNSKYNWDISGAITFVRHSGHNVGRVRFSAGHGYSHSWCTYIDLERTEAHGVRFEPVTCLYGGDTWLAIKVNLSNANYQAGIQIDYKRGTYYENSMTLVRYLCTYPNQNYKNEEIYNSIQAVDDSWIVRGRRDKMSIGNLSTTSLSSSSISSTGTISASTFSGGSFSGSSVSATESVSGASLSATGEVSAASAKITGNLSAGSITVSGYTLSIS